MPHKILMVDDKIKNITATKRFLEMNLFDVDTAQSSAEALSLLKKQEYALVLLDYDMPEMKGDTLASMIREAYPTQQVAMFSCDLSRDALNQSYQAGAIDFIEKTEEPKKILAKVQSYCNRYDAVIRTIRPFSNKSENRKLIESTGMVGQTEIMAKAAEKIQKFALAGDVTVSITGESGTGKELVARALHNLSRRAKGPFIAINCAAIPKDLLESELFGHMKGSFTGATDNKDGKFVLANGGTIFLDEIGDLSLEMQAKLLRVLQERTVEPVGSRVSKKIEVRVISATHKDIEDQAKKGLFREDLMYRLKVVDIELPPLRERTQDIELLVAHFTEAFNRKYNFVKHFQHRTLEVLKRYSWPGNIRELSSVIEKHLIECKCNVVTPEDLDLKLYEAESVQAGKVTLSEFEECQNKSKLEFLHKTIELVGSKAEASRRLGVTPTHLQYLLTESKAAKNKKEVSRSEKKIENIIDVNSFQ